MSLLQLLGTLGGVEAGDAFGAHLGGFVVGAALIKLFARKDYIAAHRARHWHPRRLVFNG